MFLSAVQLPCEVPEHNADIDPGSVCVVHVVKLIKV